MALTSARRGRRLLALAGLIGSLSAVPAGAGVRLEVGGTVEPADGALTVRVDVTNAGDVAAGRLEVQGELFGHHAQAALPGGVAPAAAASVWLRFPARPPRPGVHALALHLAFQPAGAAQPASQRAYLLLALGARTEPPLHLSAATASFETRGTVRVEARSADGRAHRVRLRALAPRGLNALGEAELAVPATGAAAADLPLIRTGSSRREVHEVLVLGATDVDGIASTAVARASVQLVPHEPVLPRVRALVAVAGALLLAGAVAAEVWARWS